MGPKVGIGRALLIRQRSARQRSGRPDCNRRDRQVAGCDCRCRPVRPPCPCASSRCTDRNQFWIVRPRRVRRNVIDVGDQRIEVGRIGDAGGEAVLRGQEARRDGGPPAGIVWVNTPKSACGALMPSCALPDAVEEVVADPVAGADHRLRHRSCRPSRGAARNPCNRDAPARGCTGCRRWPGSSCRWPDRSSTSCCRAPHSGVANSQRRPRFTVSFGVTRQSS